MRSAPHCSRLVPLSDRQRQALARQQPVSIRFDPAEALEADTDDGPGLAWHRGPAFASELCFDLVTRPLMGCEIDVGMKD